MPWGARFACGRTEVFRESGSNPKDVSARKVSPSARAKILQQAGDVGWRRLKAEMAIIREEASTN